MPDYTVFEDGPLTEPPVMLKAGLLKAGGSSLEIVKTNITLDIYNYDTTPSTVKAIALDSNTRYVAAALQNANEVYDLPSSATVELYVRRPDNTGVQITGATYAYDGDGGTQIYGAYAELTQLAIAKKGSCVAQFKITVGEQILRTEIFAISVGQALDADIEEWAGDLDGHNLDEMEENIETLQTDLESIKIGYESGSGKTVIQANVTKLEDLPVHKVYYFGAGVTSSQITDAPEYGVAAVVRTDSYKVDNNVNGAVQWFIVANGGNRVYIRGCVNYTWSAWKQIDIDVNAFTASGVQIVNAGVSHLSDLPANKVYYWNGGLNASQVEDAPYYGVPAIVYWTGYQLNGGTNGAVQWFVTMQTNKVYFRTKFNNVITPWQILNNWEDDEEYKIFAKVAVAGDSLATGWCYADGIDEQRRRRNIQFCWPTFVGRDAGTEWFNIGQSGFTTRDFLNSSEGYGLNYARAAGRKPQAYVIALGVNDRIRPVTLGTLADINIADQAQNADTYYGNYSQIIYQFKQINPQAKIFCLTNPMSVGAEYNAAIRELVAEVWANNGVYVVDLANNPWTNLYTLDKGITTDLSNSHYAPVAYQKMARIIERSISQVIRANQADFHNVPYIPYDTASANVE